MWELKEYRYATSPREAVAMMRRGPGRGAYIAGGTDIYLAPPPCDFVVDVSHAGIDKIARTPDGDLFIGAAVTLHDLATSPLVTGFANGELSLAAAHCGNRPVRSTATVGGNICNALPSADIAPVLLALDAVCHIADIDSQDDVPLADFFVAPRVTVLGDRLLVGFAVPAAAGARSCAAYKLMRSAEDISLVQVCVSAGVRDGTLAELRIALGAVAPVPLRALRAEARLTGHKLARITPDLIEEAAVIAAGECAPRDDHRASAEYRRDMVRVLTRRQITRALGDRTADDNGEGSVA